MAFIEVQFSSVLYLIIAFLSIFPLVAFSVAYRRIRDKRILLTLIGFLLFLLKSLILSSELFFNNFDDNISLTFSAILDLLIISFITVPLFHRIFHNNDEEKFDQNESEENESEENGLEENG